MSSFFFALFFGVEICLTWKTEQRLMSTNVDIHKSWDSLYLSCAFLIFYLSKASKLILNLFKQFQQNLLCIRFLMPIDHNHESFGFLVVLALCLPPTTYIVFCLFFFLLIVVHMSCKKGFFFFFFKCIVHNFFFFVGGRGSSFLVLKCYF